MDPSLKAIYQNDYTTQFNILLSCFLFRVQNQMYYKNVSRLADGKLFFFYAFK